MYHVISFVAFQDCLQHCCSNMIKFLRLHSMVENSINRIVIPNIFLSRIFWHRILIQNHILMID